LDKKEEIMNGTYRCLSYSQIRKKRNDK